MKRALPIAAVVFGLVVAPAEALAQAAGPEVTLTLPGNGGPQQMVPALKILLLFTVLSLAPAILISMTSFTRIVIVLSFVKQALGAQNAPPTQVVMALSLLLTAVVMAPVAHELNERALDPYIAERIDDSAALSSASEVMRRWLMRHTREQDVVLFHDLARAARPSNADDVSLLLLVPAFMISELRTGFEMGFLVFLPFVLIDLIAATILTAMGMVMLPPTMVSTPLKLLLFVVVDGWALLTRSLVASYQ